LSKFTEVYSRQRLRARSPAILFFPRVATPVRRGECGAAGTIRGSHGCRPCARCAERKCPLAGSWGRGQWRGSWWTREVKPPRRSFTRYAATTMPW